MKQLKRLCGKIKDKWKKQRSIIREGIKNTAYFVFFRKLKIKNNVAVVESRGGEDFASNLFYLAKELEQRGIQLYIPYKEQTKEKIKTIIKNGQFSHAKLVRMYSYRYYKLLAVAKFLANDIAFDWKYIKRDEQVYVNTWHGTPLKTLGFDIPKGGYTMGNIQRNFLMVDYLTAPSDYFTEKILSAYHVDRLYPGKILHSGYPRNAVFFDEGLRDITRKRFGLEGYQVIVYMPTWRGGHTSPETSGLLQKHLLSINADLMENQILYVKLHNMDRQSVCVDNLAHVRHFPQDIDCYQFLTAADCLITDYSSIFFDFANTGRKIVLFPYDKEQYLKDRNLYFDVDRLPFPCVRTVKDLVKEINEGKNYDDRAFREEFCTYDHRDAAREIIDVALGGENVEFERVAPNGKKNVLIYCGGLLLKNGIVTSLKNLLAGLDTDQYNYFFSFTRQGLPFSPPLLDELPDGIQIYPISSPLQKTLLEVWAYRQYYNRRKNRWFYRRLWDRLMKREMQKHFPQFSFDVVVDFEGYGTHQMIPILQNYPGKRVIFVHNDMVAEMHTRNNQHPYVLRDAYRSFDTVAIVSQDLYKPTLEISGREDNIVVVQNSHHYEGIRRRAKMEISFERDTEVRTWNPEGISGVLSQKGYKFITIGRFSPEKGHLRLLDAFDCFCDRYGDAQLIIIGGHGDQYGATLKRIQRMRHWRNITVIKSMKNPMPILSRCDLFMLPSHYEGLGLVILEADCLGVPPFATDITGPRAFMHRYKGHLVENSTLGILRGMYDFVDGKVHTLDINYEEYNQNAYREFTCALEGDETA